MKNTKVLMSLVAASIAAMAAAPELLKEETKTENIDTAKTDSNLIKLNPSSENIDPAIKAEIQSQVNALLAKKTPIMKMSESISVLVDNYGNENGSIKDTIYKELNLGVGEVDDSTKVRPGGLGGLVNKNTNQNFCHGACHGACHSACHGSRGWR